MTRPEALTALLALPTEVRCAHRRTYAGKGDPWIIKRDLAMAYATWRWQGQADISCVVSPARRLLTISIRIDDLMTAQILEMMPKVLEMRRRA